jgi:hypothetical protein
LDAGPGARLERLVVEPVRGGGVAAHLHVLAQLLVADRSTLLEQLLDLAQDQSVAFEGRRVVGLLEPDVPPDALRLDWRGKAAEPLPQLGELRLQPFVDR